MGRNPFLLPSTFPQNRGGASGRRRRASPAAQGTAAAGAMGEREREARGVDSPLDFREEGPQGGEPWRRAAVVAPLRGSTAAKERRESERKPLGPCSLPLLGLGRSEVGCPRGPAAASRGARGGGAAELGRRRAAAGVAVVVGKRRRGLLIGVGRRWGGGRVVGGPASSAERL